MVDFKRRKESAGKLTSCRYFPYFSRYMKFKIRLKMSATPSLGPFVAQGMQQL